MTPPWPSGKELVTKIDGGDYVKGSSMESKAALQRGPSNTLRDNESFFEDSQRGRASRQGKWSSVQEHLSTQWPVLWGRVGNPCIHRACLVKLGRL